MSSLPITNSVKGYVWVEVYRLIKLGVCPFRRVHVGETAIGRKNTGPGNPISSFDPTIWGFQKTRVLAIAIRLAHTGARLKCGRAEPSRGPR